MKNPTLIWKDESAEVWHADSLNPEHVAIVMGERLADLLCIDAPFSARTHEGHKAELSIEPLYLSLEALAPAQHPPNCVRGCPLAVRPNL